MPTSPVRSLIEHIRRAVAPEGDGELLGRFVESRDERALAALVERHGPMVWGVCRHLLSHHDAEDAFQATFIVLARKAGSVKPREMVGNWLYGVARQAALQARTARCKEIQVAQMPDVEAPQDRWADVRPILDEELSHLPDHYRAVIVLSDLEGRTRRDVAAHLGCPEGTVASRLVRARAMLAKRLTQRDVALSGAALVLSLNVASAAVPASLVSSTIKAASLCGQVSLKVAALTEGVLKTMLLTKLKSVTAVLVIAVMVGVLGFGIARGQPTNELARKNDDKPKVEGAVVKEKAEKAVAWGKEVDGLQIGLVADGGTCRPGEKVKLTVKLRNVGKADAKVAHGLMLDDYPPEITATDGGKTSVFMPPDFGIIVIPTEQIIKPGQTITLYNPKVAVESETWTRPKGLSGVDTPTISVEPGKYKIAYSGMIFSHPKLTTGTVEIEVKDQVAWGKEANGLQAGLSISNANDVHIGGKAKMVAMLRNVSKETIKVSVWPLWTCYPGVVDATGNRVRTTRAPSPVFEIIPTALTLKPGETVDVGRSDLLVAEPDQKVTVPDGVVDMCVIHVKPGMYKADCIGFLKDNHTLATGTVEFEVKPAKESFTAWGEEVDGVQVGIQFGEDRTYKVGETVTLIVRLRNNGKKDVPFIYDSEYFEKNPPLITDADGKVAKVKELHIFGIIRKGSVAPGKEADLCKLRLDLRPETDRKKDEAWTLYGSGKFYIQYMDVPVVGEPRLEAPVTTHATGKLELEVKEADDKKPTIENPDKKPVEREAKQKDKEAFTKWGEESGGLQAGLGYKAGERSAHSQGETVTLVVRVRNVGKEAVKFRYVRQFFLESPPAVTDGKGKSVALDRVTVFGFHALVPVDLAPGKEIEVGERQLELKPTLYGTGKFSVQYERLETSENDKTLSKLATGKLELEVTSSR